MKRVYLGICIPILCLFLVGCNNADTKESKNEEVNDGISNEDGNEKKKEEVVDGMDIFDFYFINKAPAVTEKHPLDELIKIYFSTKAVVIDVENNEFLEKL